jgi:hypothetical protein
LTYSSGGLTAAISLEDNDLRERFNNGIDDTEKDAVFPTVAGVVTFDAGSFLVTAAGAWQSDEDSTYNDATGPNFFNDTDDNWWVGAGAIIRLSDMFRLEGAIGAGEGYTSALYTPLANPQANEDDMEYWAANVLAVVSFAESWRLELGAAYTDLDHESDENIDEDDAIDDVWTVGASAFWDPVDQLTLGVGVGFSHAEANDGDADYDAIRAGFGAWFRF